MMASQARNSFQKVMSKGMTRPMHSISGLLSMIKQDNMGNEQDILVDTMVKTSSVLSTLINDVMEISTRNNGRFPLEMRYFHLHSMIKEAACLAKCVSISKGFNFSIEVKNSLPNRVMGDERRIFQVILHMVGNLLNCWDQGLSVTFRASAVTEYDQRWAMWRPNSSDGYAYIMFKAEVHSTGFHFKTSALSAHNTGRKYSSGGVEGGLSFTMCKKLLQEEATTIKAARKTWYKTMVSSESDYAEFDTFSKWLGVSQGFHSFKIFLSFEYDNFLKFIIFF
ncbi:hypothetical protein GIB67_042058 [Kingdonia uniflora]|uniref:Uncharacterized protein n=1 Tax=Kingdonia uniflora TaxID=39325 RepID=A0A7J7MVY0_9MAGN|nr:hypothetical protein GIB67_042058 [Kingdonia uniflora]